MSRQWTRSVSQSGRLATLKVHVRTWAIQWTTYRCPPSTRSASATRRSDPVVGDGALSTRNRRGSRSDRRGWPARSCDSPAPGRRPRAAPPVPALGEPGDLLVADGEFERAGRPPAAPRQPGLARRLVERPAQRRTSTKSGASCAIGTAAAAGTDDGSRAVRPARRARDRPAPSPRRCIAQTPSGTSCDLAEFRRRQPAVIHCQPSI